MCLNEVLTVKALLHIMRMLLGGPNLKLLLSFSVSMYYSALNMEKKYKNIMKFFGIFQKVTDLSYSVEQTIQLRKIVLFRILAHCAFFPPRCVLCNVQVHSVLLILWKSGRVTSIYVEIHQTVNNLFRNWRIYYKVNHNNSILILAWKLKLFLEIFFYNDTIIWNHVFH